MYCFHQVRMDRRQEVVEKTGRRLLMGGTDYQNYEQS